MKKKFLTIILALVLMTTLVACGNEQEAEEVEKTEEVAEETEKIEEEPEEVEETDGADDHEHGEYEWIGEFELEPGEYMLHFGESPDETLDIAFVKLGDNITDLEHHAAHLMIVEDKEVIKQDGKFEAKPDYAYTIEMDPEHGHVYFEIKEAGTYALVTEHEPSENMMQLFGSDDIEIMPVKEYEGAAH